MLNQLILDMSPTGQGQAGRAAAIADERSCKPTRSAQEAGGRLGAPGLLAVQEGATIWHASAMRSTRRCRVPSSSRDLGQAQGGHGEPQGPAPPLNDKIEEASAEEHPGGARETGRGPAAHQETMSGDDKSAFESFDRMAERSRRSSARHSPPPRFSRVQSDDLMTSSRSWNQRTPPTSSDGSQAKMGMLGWARRTRSARAGGPQGRPGTTWLLENDERPKDQFRVSAVGAARSHQIAPFAIFPDPSFCFLNPERDDRQARFLILADGDFSPMTSKTATR